MFKKFIYYSFSLLVLCFFYANSSKAEIIPAYDYYAKEIVIEPTYPTVNQDVVIKIKIENLGDLAATSTSNFDSYSINFEDFELTSAKLDSVTQTQQFRPGKEIFYEIKGKFTTKGLKDLSFTIDSDNELAEENENNNSISGAIRIENYDDLSIEDISFTPEKPAMNQDITIRIKGKNKGNRNLTSMKGLTTYELNFPDFVIDDISSSTRPSVSSPVEPDEFFYIDVEGRFLTGGEKLLEFQIDTGDELVERQIDDNTDFVDSNANNYYSEYLTVLSVNTDFEVNEVEVDLDKNVVNYDTEITYLVKNNGETTWTTADGLKRSYYKYINDVDEDFPGFVIESKTQDEFPSLSNPIKSGEKYKFIYTGRFEKIGTHNLYFGVDVNNKVMETNENNNATTTSITIYSTENEVDAFKVLDFELNYISSSSIEVKWNTSKLTQGKVLHRYKCCEFPVIEVESEVSDDGAYEHSVIIDDFKPDVGYYYKIVATRDSVTKDLGLREFWMPATNQIKFTSNPSVLVDSANKKANIAWSTNIVADANLYYKLKESEEYSLLATSTAFSAHSFDLTNLDFGEYEYYVIASSTVNTSATSQVQSFSLIEPIKEREYSAPTDYSVKDVYKLSESKDVILVTNGQLFKKLKGKILLKIEDAGEAWYVSPVDAKKYYLGRPKDAFNIMRTLGIGATNADLAKIQVGDKYVPKMARTKFDHDFAKKHSGKIFLAVEENGEAWYVNPTDLKRYYLGRPEDAFKIMRELSTGITNEDFISL